MISQATTTICRLPVCSSTRRRSSPASRNSPFSVRTRLSAGGRRIRTLGPRSAATPLSDRKSLLYPSSSPKAGLVLRTEGLDRFAARSWLLLGVCPCKSMLRRKRRGSLAPPLPRRSAPALRAGGWRGCGHPRSARHYPAVSWARRSRSGSHEKGLFSWRSTRAEIGDIRLNSGSETQIGLAGKRGLLVV